MANRALRIGPDQSDGSERLLLTRYPTFVEVRDDAHDYIAVDLADIDELCAALQELKKERQ